MKELPPQEPQQQQQEHEPQLLVCTVGIVDGHFLSRAGLKALTASLEGFRCVWCAHAAAHAEEKLKLRVPDILLVDVVLPDSNGLDFVRALHVRYPQLKILVISVYDEMLYTDRVLKAGARGYLKKDSEAESFESALRTVSTGRPFVTSAVSEHLLTAYYEGHRRGADGGLHLLSDREFEVLQLLGKGLNTARISSHLGISPKTVDVHRGKIKKKLDYKYAADVVRMAMRWVETGGLVRGPEQSQH
ncbi:response regulator transcription factor [Roseimicrobium sp. ORNL1]|uniref:response regulator n=1 Tax=Roseimicrobium sp. ORNL1 TaxID=2711231 RepID=UPI0013E1E71E|nr:response regulator transcription factor [Roseimicrobium sp. ORNL1]QIF04261.1 response regulator transcription factor [Roseimicrobium sp. ORNL1]